MECYWKYIKIQMSNDYFINPIRLYSAYIGFITLMVRAYSNLKLTIKLVRKCLSISKNGRPEVVKQKMWK